MSACQNSPLWRSEAQPDARLARLFEWISFAGACFSELLPERPDAQTSALSMACALGMEIATSDPDISAASRLHEPRSTRLSTVHMRAACQAASTYDPFNVANDKDAQRQHHAILSGLVSRAPVQVRPDLAPSPIANAHAYVLKRKLAPQGLPSSQRTDRAECPRAFARKLASYKASGIQRGIPMPRDDQDAETLDALLLHGRQHLGRFDAQARFLANPRLDSNLARDIASHALNAALAGACSGSAEVFDLAAQSIHRLSSALDEPQSAYSLALARLCAYDIHLWIGAILHRAGQRGRAKVELCILADRAALLARLVHKAYDPLLSEGPLGPLWNRPESVAALANLRSLFEVLAESPALQGLSPRFEKIAGFGLLEIADWEAHVDSDEARARLVEQALQAGIALHSPESNSKDPTPASLAALSFASAWSNTPAAAPFDSRPAELAIDALAWAIGGAATEFYPDARDNFSKALALFGGAEPSAPRAGLAMEFFDRIVIQARSHHPKFIPAYRAVALIGSVQIIS